jgi:hypothetical protein
MRSGESSGDAGKGGNPSDIAGGEDCNPEWAFEETLLKVLDAGPCS